MKIKCLFLYILLISCKSNTNTIYEFDPRVLKENKASLTEIADDIIYIPLDNDFPISLIYSPKYFINNSIYLSALNAGVMVFDRQGRLIRKIGRIGRGPGEYARYYIFTVDNKNETVYIMDSGANFIKVYSKEGNFLRNISLKDYGNGVDAVEFFNSKLIISYHSQFRDIKNDLIVLDTLGNFIDKKERIDIPFTSNWLIGGGLEKTVILTPQIGHVDPLRFYLKEQMVTDNITVFFLSFHPLIRLCLMSVPVCQVLHQQWSFHLSHQTSLPEVAGLQ